MEERRDRMKFTTQRQFFMLLGEMKKCPWLGKGAPVSAVRKRSWDEEWERVRGILNAAGPPVRSSAEWKKIWVDLRRRARKKLEVNKVNTNGEDSHTIALTHLEKEVAEILGLPENTKSLREPFIVGKAQKRTHEEISDDIALAEFQFVSETNPLSPVHINPCTAVSRVSSTSASTDAISAVSAAVFKAVSAAASAAASTIASTAALTDASTSATTSAKTDVPNPQRFKDDNDECLKLLRQQVAYQQIICTSLDRIANAVELYVGESRTRQAVEAVTELPDLI